MSAAVTGRDPRATTPVSDLSESGVFVHTDDPLPIGSDIELRFTAFAEPGHPVLFEAKGRVVRHAVEGEPTGMGVEFVELADTARDVLHKIMLRDEVDRQSRSFATTDETLRTHDLVALLQNKSEGS